MRKIPQGQIKAVLDSPCVFNAARPLILFRACSLNTTTPSLLKRESYLRVFKNMHDHDSGHQSKEIRQERRPEVPVYTSAIFLHHTTATTDGQLHLRSLVGKAYKYLTVRQNAASEL